MYVTHRERGSTRPPEPLGRVLEGTLLHSVLGSGSSDASKHVVRWNDGSALVAKLCVCTCVCVHVLLLNFVCVCVCTCVCTCVVIKFCVCVCVRVCVYMCCY